ncbi:MAG: TonB-dependent receptor [Chlorobiaceae bacterium]|nr:TonB-dependent receptor [Chlorobiaceae bacterium]
MTKKSLLFLAASMVFTNAASAVEPSVAEQFDTGYVADELVVTGARFLVNEKEFPRFLTVADSEKLKKTGATNAFEALSRIGGLGSASYAPFGVSFGGMTGTLAVRGLTGGALVLVNGVPIQESNSNSYDLSTLPVDQIERIEVLRGAASTLYGANAMTGVINIITRKPAEKSSATASVEFGNESWMNHGVSLSLPGVTVGLRYQHIGAVDNYGRTYKSATDLTVKSTNSLKETDRYMVNVNASPFANTYIDYRYAGSKSGIVYSKDMDYDSDFHFLDLRYEKDAFKVKIYGTIENRLDTEYVIGTKVVKSAYERNSYDYGAQADYCIALVDDIELIPGADYIHRHADYEPAYQDKSRDDYGVFAQLKKRFGDDLILTLGARQQFLNMPKPSPDHEVFLPSAGVTWKVSSALNLFANTGKAFQEPSFTQLYGTSGSFAPSPNLKPECGWSYEAGFKWDNERASARFALFRMDYRDKIYSKLESDNLYHYYNAGSYETKGIDWDLRLRPFQEKQGFLGALSFSSAGYWADPLQEDAQGLTSQPGPKFQNTLGISYGSEPFTLDMKCRTVAAREKGLSNYSAYDLVCKIKAGPGHVTAGLENLFDTKIQLAGNFLPGASIYEYVDPGRLVRIGYAATF